MDNNTSSLGIEIKIRLVYAKRLFNIGIEHEVLGSEMDRLVAVMHYDASIEHLLNTILAFFEEPSKKENYERFSTLWDNVNKALEKNKEKIVKFELLPNRREIKQLHDVRNSAQHSGIIPSSESVQRFRQTAETFMKNVINNIFKRDYSEISSAILMQNEKVKKYIEEAEKHFLNGEYKKSIKSSFLAFYVAKSDEQGKINGSGSMAFRMLSEIRKSKRDKYKNTKIVEKLYDGQDLNNSELTDYISMVNELMLKELEIFKLKLDYKKYMQYIKFCPDVLIYDVDTNEIEIQDNVCNYENAFFCLNSVIDSILKWESFRSQTY